MNKVLQDNPKLKDDPAIVLEAKNLDILHSISALHDTEGGKALAKLFVTAAVNGLGSLRAKYLEASHTELIVLISGIAINLDNAQLLVNAKESKKVQETILNEMIEEALLE